MFSTKSFSAEKIELVAFVLKTIAHPMRIAIIDILKDEKELTVNEICKRLNDADQSLVSHNLANMKYKGVLGSRREGRNIYYHLKLMEVLSVLDCMEKCDLKLR